MEKELITNVNPKSPISEAFRTLRTNIQFMSSSKQLKSLLVTSTLPGEGKSWTASNLAVTFAQAGKRVILVDADMRKGRQFSIFRVPPVPGLSNYLSNIDSSGQEVNFELQNVVRETKIENLYIIPAGNVPPNPSELLVSEKMVAFIKELESICDIVIFDGTPSLLVTDAAIISRLVDSTIIVVAHKETEMNNLVKVKKMIENVGGKIAGIVFNKIPVSGKAYEGSYYYYGNSVTSLPKQTSKKTTQTVKRTKESEPPKKESKVENTVKPINSNVDTQDLLKQINQYLEEEKSKLKKQGK